MSTWNNWGQGSRVTPAAFVTEADTLLSSVLHRLRADDRVRGDLLAGLTAALRTEGREAVLTLAGYEGDHDHRGTIARQARDIGASLSRLAAATGTAASDVTVRSHCEGHVWTEAAAAHLTGAPDAPAIMQLYNEWLHQLVLLRDALLPYENWEEVTLAVDAHGLRRFGSARQHFVADLLTRRVRHEAIVRVAAAAVSDTAVDGAYGFQTEAAAVLPAVVSGSPWTSSRTLLRWQSDRITDDVDTVAFVAADADYLATSRSLPGDPAPLAQPLPEVTLGESGRDGRGIRLALSARGDAGIHSVDLGQALRGHRYAYSPAGEEHTSGDEVVRRHSALAVVAAAGLVEFPPGLHLVDDIPDAGWGLLVLGRILPHNIILRDGQSWAAASTAGKTGPPRVILDAPRSGSNSPL
ncbi:MAG: hypothetical protein WAW17_04525 [Rhodococcus sp. (in: high G+C Gram-positive bacteria)]|uniref:hypothetical protein n=1 Tax=Rhodococcus sp. TaxID=1831 RepID=UPI003BB15A90